MAQDAELKLRVSLDLGFFRQQLAGLGQAAAGYNIPIQVKFDRRSVQNELNTLGANIRRRNYFLEVKTNLKQEIDRAQTLAKLLNELPKGGGSSRTAGVASAGFSQTQLRKLGEDIKPLYKAAAEAGLVQFDKTIQNNRTKIAKELAGVGQDSIAGLLNGLKSGDKQLQGAAKSLGKELIASMKNVLGIASPSKVFDALGRFTAEGFDDGFTRRFKEFKNDAVAEIRQLVALLKFELAKAGDMGVGAGIGAARAGVRGGRQYMAPIGPLPIGSGQPWAPGTRGMYGQSGYEPYMGGPGRQLPRAFSGTPGIASTTSTASMLGIGLPALPAAGMSSAAGMRQAQLFAREAAARARSAERSMAVMQENAIASRVSGQVPLGGGGRFLPPAGPPGGGGGGGGNAGGFGQFGRAMGGISLPGAGTIRELGTEFSFAAKQVLLFGTAYKALAFIQDFPGQVSQAVGQLQSFRNTLQSVTGNAEMAGQANEFILAAVERYNIPLQSARDGFVKLFASMEPAGFAAGEIQNLFLGITKAAATYGMSADKVDRVNYAFAQMASKGQVMSEELKGQLGDVLPGAMGIFAEAAGFKGPDAIQKFNKALEDGVYKGGEMRKLLKNVADGMNKEFGPGAEGAAKTFQGSMNRMQNALKGFYESFEPAAIGVLNQVAVPLVGTLKNITEGVNAYFKGQAAATPEAQKFTDTLKTLIPTIGGIAENVKVVLGGLASLGSIFVNVALQAGRLLALPIVGYLASTYAQVLVLSTAFTFLANSAIGAAIVAITRFIGQGIVYAQVTLGMRVATQQTTVAMYQFGTAVQTVMIKSVIGIALVAITSLVAKFVELQNAMAAVSGQAKAMKDAAKASAQLGDVTGVKEAIGNMEDRVETYRKLQGQLSKAIGSSYQNTGFKREISAGLAKELMSLGLVVESSMSKAGANYKVKVADLRDAYNLATKNVSEFNQAIRDSYTLVGKAQQRNQQLKRQSSVQGGGAGAEEGKQRKVPLNEMLDLESQRQFRMKEADEMEKLNQKIRDAREQGNAYEAERLEASRESVRLGIETAALQDYINLLINEEANIIGGKVLTQKAFDNKLEDAKIQLYVRQKDLKEAIAKVGDKERDQQKKIREEQEKFASTLIGIKFDNGYISTQEYNRLKINEEIAKILQEFPSLSKQQKDEVAGIIRNKQTQLRTVREEIELLRAINDIERRRIELRREGYSESKIKEILDLEKVRDNIKQVRQLVDDFVTSTSSDYKGFLKAVISGEDAADALQQFQEGLQDRVVTIFLDFTMKPVEDFFKNVAGGKLIETLFPKGKEEEGGAGETPVEQKLTEANQKLQQIADNTSRIGAGSATGLGGSPMALTDFASYSGGQVSNIFANSGISLQGQGFGQASAGIDMAFKDISESSFSFSESLNANADSIANATKGVKANGTSFIEGLGGVVQGIGMLAGAAMGIVGGIQQMQKGGTKNTLAGIGSILMGVGGAIGGFMNLGKMGKAANGAVWQGGFQAFANGGMVSGPTLGLIGEGKYNEAIVPLPNGKAIPVQLNSDSIREKMSGSSNGGSVVSPMLSMNFETTTINNVEYVSRDQLERAMMETRKLATRDGARQGANLAIDKLQQSPTTRRKIGI